MLRRIAAQLIDDHKLIVNKNHIYNRKCNNKMAIVPHNSIAHKRKIDGFPKITNHRKVLVGQPLLPVPGFPWVGETV